MFCEFQKHYMNIVEHNCNICHIFLGYAIQNNVCACIYVISILLKRERMATAQFKKEALVDKEKDVKMSSKQSEIWLLNLLKNFLLRNQRQ